ncbi:MAG TPA: GntR family transcriptional regulator [Ideonella sp.]|uniref:GntR family transcriptional regulator n=1 Tax=Ideonella sp. TaxID=1929293 RepID=UPI002E2ED14B|nr:GntR family transcriptional regulator [Ideonella sp.]HEX5686794.1 GntR family transcriptional regulator [Ideonella sp.]
MPPTKPRPDSGSVVATLRQLIMGGHYPAGTRLAEIPVATALGVSRTPVRLAFRSLQQEGLLQVTGKRGFVVRAFSEEDVQCAVEVRGALEGLAARRLAERSMPAEVQATLRTCIDDGARLLAKGHLTEDDIGAWGELNHRFHRTIVEATGSLVIADAIARNNHLPFASADSIAIDRQALDREYEKLRFAQAQHQLVFEALQRRESARVEMLMREHAYIGLRYGSLFGLTPSMAAAEP